ncbi:putative peptidoglycan O-acetyltransferase YrhL [Porphyridium purpureum]|uniref:Putative peptidoglycan O-acetyltransferase YrhL n=1 Tax=Porphyridium purpureum TaxID=35688 RepID=A0A5J4YJE2_PORPP|nr:putative peptidoglycan O-acetyltransferase YrhL [Porphyridium purpureum]|eukprot:POR7966..scf291_13
MGLEDPEVAAPAAQELSNGHTPRTRDAVLKESEAAAAAHAHTYLTHLDGLRAVALGGVLLFHAGFPHAAGGFVGVDIFFVLSGFLISGNLLQQFNANKFSWRDFYFRRFWRLYPSLLCTCIWSLALGAALFSGPRLAKLGLSVLSSLGWMSNVLFYSEAGYWDAASKSKPLLHTWSLSIEDQFYLLWPGTLLALVSLLSYKAAQDKEKQDSRLLGVFCASCFVWFAVAYGMNERDPSMAFFLMPARVYQFCMGTVLCFLYSSTKNLEGAMVDLLSFLCSAIVFVSIFTLERAPRDHFIGFFTMPCLLASMTLMMFPRSYVCTKWLSHPSLRWVGKVSYSVYLVHWPLITYLDFLESTSKLFAALAPFRVPLVLFLAFALGFAQYSFVESRFRLRDSASGSQWAGMLAAVLVAVGGSLSAFYLNAEIDGRIGSTTNISTAVDFLSNNLTIADARQLTLEQWNQILKQKGEPWELSRPLVPDAMEGLRHLNRYRLGFREIKNPKKGWGLEFCYNHSTPFLKESDRPICDIGEEAWPMVIVFGDSMWNPHYPSLSELAIEHKVRFRMLDQAGCVESFLDLIDHSTSRTYSPRCAEVRSELKHHIDTAPAGTWVLIHYYSAYSCQLGSTASCVFQNGNRVRGYFPEMEYIKKVGKRVAVVGDAMIKGKKCPSDIKNWEDCYGPNVAAGSMEAFAKFVVEDKLAEEYVDILDCFRVADKRDGEEEDIYALKIYGGTIDLMNDDHHLSYYGGMMAYPCLTRSLARMFPGRKR